MPRSATTSQKPDQRATAPGHVRAFAGAPTSVDEATRSFDIVITTETPVVRCIPDPRVPRSSDPFSGTYIEVGEVLVAAGIDLSRAPRMPFVDCHDTYTSIDKILGKVDDIRVEGTAIVGRVTLTRKRADLLPDIVDGFYGQISAGYFYDDKDTELVEQPDGGMPLLLVKRWTLTEASAVPVAADPNAFIRSLGSRAAPEAASPTEEKTMDIEEIIAAAEEAAAAADAALEAAEEAVGADGTAEELVERVKALRGKRSEEDTAAAAEEKPKPEDTTAEGERADDAEMTDEEKKDIENVRSIAKGYGLDGLVTDLRALGAKPAQIRAAVSKSIAERGAPAASDPVVVKTPVRSAVESFNPNSVYAARNKR